MLGSTRHFLTGQQPSIHTSNDHPGLIIPHPRSGVTQCLHSGFTTLADPSSNVNRMVTRHVKQCIRQKEKAAAMTQDCPDVKHPVLTHLPIHVITFLNICDKKNSWAASPEAFLDGLMQTSVALGFLIVSYWFGANAESSKPSAGGKNF